MAGKLGKITATKRTYSGTYKTLESSLSDNGYSRTPGTAVIIPPYREANGEFRTGLDENALYISRIPDQQEREQEKARVRAEKERLESLSGLDLSPRSRYYSDMAISEGSEDVCSFAKLMDKNLFNLNDYKDAITFAWLRVHPEIAPSQASLRTGRFDLNQIMFFVDDEEWEAELEYQENTIINKAISSLDSITPTKRKKIAKLLGIGLSQDTRESVVYNELTKFIKKSEDNKGKLYNVSLFNKFAEMADERMEIRYLVEEALSLSIYRESKFKIYEGEVELCSSKEELIEMLSTSKHQSDLLALKEKIKQKLLIESI